MKKIRASVGDVDIPKPDAANPDPKRSDEWFNYRSMQEIIIIGFDGDRVLADGAVTGRSVKIRVGDFANPRWFKFLRNRETDIVGKRNNWRYIDLGDDTIAAIEQLDESNGHGQCLILEELRALNAKAARLIELWEGPKAEGKR